MDDNDSSRQVAPTAHELLEVSGAAPAPACLDGYGRQHPFLMMGFLEGQCSKVGLIGLFSDLFSRSFWEIIFPKRWGCFCWERWHCKGWSCRKTLRLVVVVSGVGIFGCDRYKTIILHHHQNSFSRHSDSCTPTPSRFSLVSVIPR